MKRMTLAELRKLLRKNIVEADKNAHADPTAAAWDSGLEESEEDHEGDPRWDDHADPTGREWHTGLEES